MMNSNRVSAIVAAAIALAIVVVGCGSDGVSTVIEDGTAVVSTPVGEVARRLERTRPAVTARLIKHGRLEEGARPT